MSQVTLPPELHKLILDVLGDEAVVAFQSAERLVGDVRLTLSSCSLVCKYWHTLTLRHTFYGVRLAVYNPLCQDREERARRELVELIEANPLIGQCVQSFDLSLLGGFAPEAIERMCLLVSPVKNLSLFIDMNSRYDLSHPSTLNSLYSLLTPSHLRHLSIWSKRLPAHLLDVLLNVQSLKLDGVEEVVADRGLRDLAGRAWRSSAMQKLVMSPASCLLASIGATTGPACDPSIVFDHLTYLDLSLGTEDHLRDGPWYAILAHWTRVETLIIRWIVVDPGEIFLTMYQYIPWASFQGLHSFTYHIDDREIVPQRFLDAGVNPSASKLILAGPSRLPQLQDLRFTYDRWLQLEELMEVHLWLDAIFRYNLNRTIEDPTTFPSIKAFHVHVECVVSYGRHSFRLEEDQLIQLLVDRLPAIYGIGGRRERYDWDTSIGVFVSRFD